MNDNPRLVRVPGGTVKLLDVKDVSERRRRPIKVAAAMLGPARLQQIYNNLPTSADGVAPDALAETLQLTRRESEIIFDLQDLSVLAVLESWTLDRPLPTTPEELQDLPAPLYDALVVGVGKRAASPLLQEVLSGDSGTEFTVAAAGDQTSPTGPSGDSEQPSTPEGH